MIALKEKIKNVISFKILLIYNILFYQNVGDIKVYTLNRCGKSILNRSLKY